MAVIEAIETVYLEADAATVTFSGIPATYEHLQVQISAKATAPISDSAIIATFNSDTGANYSYHYMKASSTTASAASATGSNSMVWFRIPAATVPATDYSAMVVDILDYANTSKNTTVLFANGGPTSMTTPLYFGSQLWDATAAVASIQMSTPSGDEFMRGSEFTLFGLASS